MNDRSAPAAHGFVTPDPWLRLASATPARLALGRSGAALPTSEVLALALAHAMARDAVHASFDPVELEPLIGGLGLDGVRVESAAPDRHVYLRRPDLGRRLSSRSRDALRTLPATAPDITVVIADGLSATAVHDNAGPTLAALVPAVQAAGLSLSPVVLAHQARVALGDEIGDILGSGLTIVLIGERPGLSAADSLGAYLTFAPRLGRTDAERNCVSNIRNGGLLPAKAAAKIAWLVMRAFSLSMTGVLLKDGSDDAYLGAPTAAIPTM